MQIELEQKHNNQGNVPQYRTQIIDCQQVMEFQQKHKLSNIFESLFLCFQDVNKCCRHKDNIRNPNTQRRR